MQNVPLSEIELAVSSLPSAGELPASLPLPQVGTGHAPITNRPPRSLGLFDPACPPILVADDDEDDTFFIQRLIKKTGASNPVKTFNDGTEVVNFLGSVRRPCARQRHRPPLLLFLDLKMRGLGGFGFLEWARQQKELAPLTIVVLSNSDCPGDMQRALELGAHRYLIKYPCAATFNSIVRSVYPLTVY